MHKVFTYGSLKKGFSNHRVLAGANYLGEDRTLNSDWFMYSMGGFPGVQRGFRNHFHHVMGELYEVDAAGLARLDMLEGNGHFYTREIILLESGEEAWMYVLPRVQMDDMRMDRGDGRVQYIDEVGAQTWM